MIRLVEVAQLSMSAKKSKTHPKGFIFLLIYEKVFTVHNYNDITVQFIYGQCKMEKGTIYNLW